MWKSALWAFAGALSGVVVGITASGHLGRTTVVVPAATTPPNLNAPPPGIDTSDLQRQISELRQAILVRPDAAAPPVQATSDDPVTEAYENAVSQHQKALASYAREGVDPKWAPETEKSLAADLAKAGSESAFTLESVSCHMTSCVAGIRFANFEDAKKNWQQVLATRYESRCGSEIVLDANPSDPAREYRTQVVFNCEKVRSGEY